MSETVRFLPGRWAETLNPWEAKAEPVRFGDHGAGALEPCSSGNGWTQRSYYRAGAAA